MMKKHAEIKVDDCMVTLVFYKDTSKDFQKELQFFDTLVDDLNEVLDSISFCCVGNYGFKYTTTEYFDEYMTEASAIVYDGIEISIFGYGETEEESKYHCISIIESFEELYKANKEKEENE